MLTYPLCPFYESMLKNTLTCESRDIKFPTTEDKKTWLAMHCNSKNYVICKFYIELMKKYDEYV